MFTYILYTYRYRYILYIPKLKPNYSCICWHIYFIYTYIEIISSLSRILFIRLVILNETTFHEYFQQRGVCFINKRCILLLLPNGRRLFPKKWRSVFPMYFRGVFFHCEASASYGPLGLRKFMSSCLYIQFSILF